MASPSPPPKEKRLSPRETTQVDGAVRDIVLSLLSVALPMFALTAIFLGLVYANQVETPPDESGTAYYVNYSATRLITVSSWTSTATSLILPFAATLLAYPVARSFQQDSATSSTDRLPTPYQLNLIVSLLSGGPGPLWEYSQYLFWKQRPRAPRLLTVTAVGIFLFFGLGLGILLADTWLHVTTSTIPYGIVESARLSETQLGRGMSAECFPVKVDTRIYDPCISGGQLYGQSSRFLRNPGEAYRTLANLSALNSVRTSTIDGKAIAHIVDQSSSFDLDYEAPSIGVQTECSPITTLCGLIQDRYCPRDACVSQSSYEQTFTYSCPGGLTGDLSSSSGVAFTNGSSNYLESMTAFFMQFYDESDFQRIRAYEVGAPTHSYANPLHFITGSLVPPSDQLAADPEARPFTTTDSVGVILGCHSTVVDMIFSFRNGTVAGGSYTPANDTLSTGLGWAMSDYRGRSGFQSYLDSAVTGSAIACESAEDMAARFAQSYSEISMGIMAGIMTPRTTVEERVRQNVLVARVPKAPFFTLLALNLLYGSFGTLLGAWALSGKPRVVRDVQVRLSVAGLVSNLLEPDGVPHRGGGIEALFSDKRQKDAAPVDKRVAIERADDQRWTFRVVPSSRAATDIPSKQQPTSPGSTMVVGVQSIDIDPSAESASRRSSIGSVASGVSALSITEVAAVASAPSHG